MDIQQKLAAFAALVEQQQRDRFAVKYPGPILAERMQSACSTQVYFGKKYARVDVGSSGKYMVNLETGEIIGIKGYGIPHLGYQFGTLDTVNEWDWSGYHASRRASVTHPVE